MQFLDKKHPHVYEYLPEPNIELPKTPKAWIANICATVLEDKFSKWVKMQVNARHEKVTIKKDLSIMMDPEMAAIFQASTAVSSKCYLQRKLYLIPLFYSYQGRFGQSIAGREQEKTHCEADCR